MSKQASEQTEKPNRRPTSTSDSLTAISPDSRYVFVWRDQRLSKDMSDWVEFCGAAKMEVEWCVGGC